MTAKSFESIYVIIVYSEASQARSHGDRAESGCFQPHGNPHRIVQMEAEHVAHACAKEWAS